MINLNHRTNIQFLEEAYSLISKNDQINLYISKTFSNVDFGLVPAIIQFVASWYAQGTGKIIFEVTINEEFSNLSEEELKELSNSYFYDFYKIEYIYPIIVHCWNKLIEDREGHNIKPLLKIQNELSYDKMRKQINGRGNQTILTCFDQLGTKKGLLSAFYTDDTFIDNEFQFDFALDKSLRQVISLNQNLRKSNFTPLHNDIIAVIYELIKNTDDWARTDIFNKPLNPNIRGLYLNLHRRTRESFISTFQNNIALNDFFKESNFETNSNNELYFLEISVFDTGIGFVNRFTKNRTENYNCNQQVAIIKQCLIINNTSAIGLDKKIKGKGLDRIMRILDGKGFFWLRTGNVSVFRNLIANRYKEQSDIADIDLFDWFKNSKDNFTLLEKCKGSIVTLVLPLTNLSHV